MEEFYIGLIVFLFIFCTWLIKKIISLKKTLMEMSLEQNVSYLVQAVDKLSAEVSTIKRGLYGDKENNVIGLIARQESDEKRLTLLEDDKKTSELKRNWFIGIMVGLATALNTGIHFFKELFK